ncbi:MAG: ankyrin repeat domain-containing protein [Candidatus Midichloria sp.]|nr:MAG: ankyrin repeat domain-containing protein [Candidatus Midichloria sp.]
MKHYYHVQNLGILECVKFAIERRADINAVDKNWNTALILAAQNGDEQVINRLLYKGATPGKINIRGDTAALLARCQVIKILLMH